MKRTTWNLLIDLLAAAVFLGMLATGYIIRFPLPPGTNKSFTLWGLARHQWGEIHFWISVGLLVVLLVHLALHWNWMVTMLARQFRLATGPQRQPLRSGLITVGIAFVVLALFVWVTGISVREATDPHCLSDEGSGIKQPIHLSSEKTFPDDENGKVSFWKDVYPVLKTSCLTCHGPQKAFGDFRIDQREDYFGQNTNKPLVIPGKSEESSLIAIVSGRRPNMAMAAVHKLPPQQVALLRAWIDTGAAWPEKIDDQ